jgi:hypothetical protein
VCGLLRLDQHGRDVNAGLLFFAATFSVEPAARETHIYAEGAVVTGGKTGDHSAILKNADPRDPASLREALGFGMKAFSQSLAQRGQRTRGRLAHVARDLRDS